MTRMSNVTEHSNVPKKKKPKETVNFYDIAKTQQKKAFRAQRTDEHAMDVKREKLAKSIKKKHMKKANEEFKNLWKDFK